MTILKTHNRTGYIIPLVYLLVVITIAAVLYRYSFNWIDDDDVITLLWYKHVFITHDQSYSSLISASMNAHPVGIQALLTTAIFYLFGFDYRFIVAVSFLVLLISAVLFSATTSRYLETPLARVALWFLVLLMVFHPSQTEHLLWPFEVGWLLVDLPLVVNAWLIERYSAKALPIVAALCLFATFCSDQGALLWMVAGFHCLLLPKPHRFWSAALFLLLGIIVCGLVLWQVNSQPGVYSLSGTNLWGLPLYGLQLLGGIFAIRDQTSLAILGALAIVLAAASIIVVFTKGRSDAPQRIGMTLIFASALFAAAFSIGRSKFGIDWATSSFHAAPLFMPFLLGLTVLTVRMIDKDRLSLRMAIWVPCLVFLTASFVSAIPYARERGNEWAVDREVAMRVTCSPAGWPDYLVRSVSGLRNYNETLEFVRPMLLTMCTDTKTAAATRVLTYPPQFQALQTKQPGTENALRSLWYLYIMHGDLQRVYHAEDPNTPLNLLSFAENDAKNGGKYDEEVLGAYQSLFLDMANNKERATTR